MSKDHFVSVTFLNNFTDDLQIGEPRNKNIFCFSKETNRFQDKPKRLGSIAYQQDLDGNGCFKDMLDKYEPKWTVLYAEISQSKLSIESYKDVLTYLILLKLNNPTEQMSRLDIVLEQADKEQILHLELLKPKEKHRQLRDILLDLGFARELKAKYLDLAFRFVKNDTSVPFVTSDNPWISSFLDYHCIPISKLYGLRICKRESNQNEAGNQGLHILSSCSEVRQINSRMLENADRFVYASTKDIF